MIVKRLALIGALAIVCTACGTESSMPASSDPTGDNASPSTAQGIVATGELINPAPGFRWVSWRNVAVQVPESWSFGYSPRSDWCVGAGESKRESPPYVEVGAEQGGTLSIACAFRGRAYDKAFGPAPDYLWATHLSLGQADGQPDRTMTENGWTLSTRTVGEVGLRLLADSSHRGEAAGVLATARTFTTDQNGCDATSPVQAKEFVRPDPFDVTRVPSVDTISICQYVRGVASDRPALMGSRQIAGSEADSLLAGLRTAPVGLGPEDAGSCSRDYFGDVGITVRLHSGATVRDIFVYYDWCFGNGSDDGRTQRKLTIETCAPLFEAPVVAWSYSSIAGPACRGTS